MLRSSRGAVERVVLADSAPYPDKQIWFIDLVGVQLSRRFISRPAVRNLARLYASFHGRGMLTRTDLLRFLRVPRLGPARLVGLEDVVGRRGAGLSG